MLQMQSEIKNFKFDKTGSLQQVWGQTGTKYGEFMAPTGLTTLRGKSEQITVCDNGNRRVQAFDTSGIFLGSYSIIGEQNSTRQDVQISPTPNPTKNPEEWVPVLKQRRLDPVSQETLILTLSELRKNAISFKF